MLGAPASACWSRRSCPRSRAGPGRSGCAWCAILAAGVALITFLNSDAAKGGVVGHTGVRPTLGHRDLRHRLMPAAAVLLWRHAAGRRLEPCWRCCSARRQDRAHRADARRRCRPRSSRSLLFALGGMMVFPAANDLLTHVHRARGAVSLPLYLMCGLARRRRLLSQEAAVKYFLLGAFASAFFLYGLALLYGYAGSVRLADIANAAAGTRPVRRAAVRRAGAAGGRAAVQGLGRPVPHLDARRLPGRAHPGHGVHGRLHEGRRLRRASCGCCTVAFGADAWDWRPVLWAVRDRLHGHRRGARLTQTDIKRMIAYSSIAHAGFLLLGAMAMTDDGRPARCSTCSPTASPRSPSSA